MFSKGGTTVCRFGSLRNDLKERSRTQPQVKLIPSSFIDSALQRTLERYADYSKTHSPTAFGLTTGTSICPISYDLWMSVRPFFRAPVRRARVSSSQTFVLGWSRMVERRSDAGCT